MKIKEKTNMNKYLIDHVTNTESNGASNWASNESSTKNSNDA